VKVWQTASGAVEIKEMSKIETMNVSFTNFSSTILTSYTKELEMDKIALVTPCHKQPQYPKIWVLNTVAD